MDRDITFLPYSAWHKDGCLSLFDANCPDFFAPNEREVYERFLDAKESGYEVCSAEGRVIGAFGLMGDGPERKSLNWILLEPQSRGMGIGASIMERVVRLARDSGLNAIEIAASHRSAAFFAKFGAIAKVTSEDGWGPGMHRVDMELGIGPNEKWAVIESYRCS